ncbi:unnamed protein product, partial [Owenia fusiformis]
TSGKMESPLNLAHLERRKAESNINKGRYDLAIACHKKAAEFLELALKTTSDNKARESIELQCDHHCRQQQLLRDKSNRLKMAERLNQMKRNASDNTIHPKDSVDESNDETDGVTYNQYIYKDLEETDSLLQFLQTRALAQAQGDRLPSIETHTKRTKDEIIQSAVKSPKTESEIIEELHINNQSLRGQVLELLKELEEKDKEVTRLQNENSALRKRTNDKEDKDSDSEKENFYSMPLNLDDLPSLPELPPLEMPTFDFDTVSASP